MNTISMIGQTQAMDGRQVYNNLSAQNSTTQAQALKQEKVSNSASEVLENLKSSEADSQITERELERLSTLIAANKLQFNVNNDSGKVIVRVYDSSTNELIREIPSEDLQKLQARMKQNIGLIFDEKI